MKGYEAIGEFGRKIFTKTHNRHLQALGTEERKKYDLTQVTRIKANNIEGVIEVSFRNGDLFKYKPNGEWY